MASLAAILAIGKPVAFDASALDRDTLGGIRHARAKAAHGEGRADHDRQPELLDRLMDLVHGETHAGAGGFAADLGDDVLESLAVLATLDRLEVGADQLDAISLERA